MAIRPCYTFCFVFILKCIEIGYSLAANTSLGYYYQQNIVSWFAIRSNMNELTTECPDTCSYNFIQASLIFCQLSVIKTHLSTCSFHSEVIFVREQKHCFINTFIYLFFKSRQDMLVSLYSYLKPPPCYIRFRPGIGAADKRPREEAAVLEMPWCWQMTMAHVYAWWSLNFIHDSRSHHSRQECLRRHL